MVECGCGGVWLWWGVAVVKGGCGGVAVIPMVVAMRVIVVAVLEMLVVLEQLVRKEGS